MNNHYSLFKHHNGQNSKYSLATYCIILILLTIYTFIPAFAFADHQNALSFDGSNDFVNVGNIPLNNKSFTIECWAKRDSFGGWDVIIGQGQAEDNRSLHIGFRDTNVFTLGFGNNDLNTSETCTYTDSNWHHWAATYDSNTKNQKIYRDGVEVASRISSSNYTGVGDVLMGRYGPVDQFHFHGNIDELRIWDTVRTQTQIQEYMYRTLSLTSETSLLAYYKFNQSSGNYLYDNSGNNHNGTLNNMDDSDWVTSTATVQENPAVSDPENALSFDGSNDFVNAGSNIHLANQSFTIEFWVTRNSTGTYDLIFSQGTSATNNNLHMGFRSTNVFTLAFGGNDLDTSATYVAEGWHHWAGTFEASSKKRIIYRDGNIVANDTSSSNFLGTGDLILGRYISNEHYHDGNVDELRIWNTARTQTQIRENMYKTISDPESSLLAYYQFNQSSGTTLYDMSGNNNNGTLTDMNDETDWISFSAPLQKYTDLFAPKNALALDGYDDYVDLGNIDLSNKSFSIEFWTKHTSTDNYEMVVFQGTGSNNAGLHIGFRDTNTFTFSFFANDLNTTSTYTDKDWHHWAATFDAVSKKRIIYRDGNFVASDTSSSNFIGSGNLLIGYYLPENKYYSGEIDELRIWTSVRTHAQIMEHMNQTLVGNETDLLAYYRFDQQFTSLVLDNTGNTDNGQLINMDPFSDFVNSSAKIHAHNGPGGIGGTNGLSNLKVWLKADSITSLSHGDSLSIWSDSSGNSNAVSQSQTANQPQFQYSQLNGHPAISFSGYPNSTGGADFDYLNMGIVDISPGTSLSIYVVGKVDSSGDHYFLGRNDPLCRLSNTAFQSNRHSNAVYNPDDSIPDTFTIMSMIADDSQAIIKWNSAQIGNAYALTSTDFIESDELWIGATQSNGYSSLDGSIAEIIIYDYTLTLSQQTILDNYLSAKYAISIPSDKYAGDLSNYDKDVAGIGKESDGNHILAQSGGLVLRSNEFLTDNGDYVMTGHSDSGSVSFTNNPNDIPANIEKRLSRIWYIDRTDGGASANGNIIIGFDFSKTGLSEMPLEPENYSLLYRSGTSGTFSIAQSITVNTIDDQVYFEISSNELNDGYYTLGWKSFPGSGNALTFDGSNDYIEIPYNENLNSSVFTVSIWAKVTGGAGSFRSVFTSRSGFGGYMVYATDTNIWSFWVDNGSAYLKIDSDSVVLNKWTHLAMTCNGSIVTGYINGVAKGQVTSFARNSSKPLRIGAGITESPPPEFYFPGELDEFRYYNILLSQDEIRDEMCKKISEKKPGLNAYYRFDHLSGTTLLDLSGNHLDGQLINMDNSDWILSDVPLGDDSNHDYNGSNASDFSVSLSYSDGDSLTAVGVSGTFQGIQLYRVNDAPNVTTPPGSFESILNTNYWGVFTVGSSPTYSITYYYGSNTYTDENSVQMACRENNTSDSWSSLLTHQDKISKQLMAYDLSNTTGLPCGELIYGIEPVNYNSSDLVAYYPFNGNANDESGNNNHGTVYNATLTTDRNGINQSAYSFNGLDKWIELTDFDVPETFSIAMWLNTGSTSNQAYIGKAGATGNTDLFILGCYNSTQIELTLQSDFYSNGSQPLGSHFLYAVVEKLTGSTSLVTVYLDNTLYWQNTYNQVVGSFTPGKAWTIGQEWDDTSKTDFFTGTIDEISFFNRPLNNTEIRYLYQGSASISTIASPVIVSDTVSFTVTTENAAQITITIHSSDQSAISDSNINLASSGANVLTLSTSASTPINLTFTMTPESNAYSRVVITCSLSRDGRLTETVSFPVILSPPGSGSALDFDGSDDYIDLPDNDWFYNDFTIESWVYYRSYASWDRLIDFGPGPSANNILIALSNASQCPEFQIYNGSTSTAVISPEQIPLNQWVHIAATSSGSVGKLYINGRLVATNSSMNQAVQILRTNAYIAKSNWSENPYANLIIDEFRIWNVTRTQSEIRQSMCQKISGQETGLVVYYSFDNHSGTTVYDLSGNERHGTLTNMAESDWITSGVPLGDISVYDYKDEYSYSLPASGKALSFDGFDDYVNLGSRAELILGNVFTIEAWIYPMHSDANYHGFIGNQTDINTPNTRSPSLFVYNQTQIHYDLYNEANTSCGGITGSILTNNQWNHVAQVFDGTTISIYVNGVCQYTSTTCSGFDLKDIPVNLIGKVNDSFYGNIDEVRLWTIARTESQIQNTMNAKLEGNETGLLAYYRFDSITGGTLYDSSGNNYHGSLYNMTIDDWVESTVPFFDPEVRLTVDNWAIIKAKGNSGLIDGMHIYQIKDAPNNTTKPDGWQTMDTTHYFGIFTAGENDTYSISFNYSSHPNISQADSFIMAYRTNATDSSWEDLTANVNADNYDINKTNISTDTASEFILGFNYIPTISSIVDQSIIEDSSMQITLTATDIDTADCSMTLTLSTSNTSLISTDNISYTCDLGNYYISLTPTANQSGTSIITLTITDAGGLTAATFFNVMVSTRPTLSEISDQRSAAGTLSFTCADSEDGPLTITALSSDESILSYTGIHLAGSDSYSQVFNVTANVSQSLSITLTPMAGQHDRITLTIIAENSMGLTSSTEFSVIVSPPGSGNALDFGGTDDYVSMGQFVGSDPISLSGSTFTLNFWVKPDLSGDDYQRIISKSSGSSSHYEAYIHTNGVVTIKVNNTAKFNSSESLEAGKWQHVAVTGDGSNYSCYFNGSPVSIILNDSYESPPNALGYLYIGKSYNVASRVYKGQVDELQIWNRALSNAEIQQNMCQKLTGSENGLLAYYRFDHQTGTTLRDLSGNGYHGTLINMEQVDWTASGAPIGDSSIFDYVGTNPSDFSASLSYANGDAFTAIGDSGTLQGIHVYLVNESPNVTSMPDSFQSMDTTHTFGVFAVGTSPTYAITYYYGANTYTNNNENQLAFRANNADTDWSSLLTIVDTQTKHLSCSTISMVEGYPASEFMFGTETINVNSSDLIAYYPFNGTFQDATGHGNDGDLVSPSNPRCVTDRNGMSDSAYVLDGTDDWIRLTDFNVPETFSVSTWLYFNDTGQNQAFIGKYISTGSVNIFLLGYYANEVNINIRDISYSYGGLTTGYHFLNAVVEKIDASNSRVTVYLDQRILWQSIINAALGADITGYKWTLGQDWDGGDEKTDFFKGKFDAVTFYNRAINPSEIRYLYNSSPVLSSIETPSSVSDTITLTVTTTEATQVTLIAHSSDQSIISDSQINIGGTGSNQLLVNTGASTPMNITLTMSSESNMYGRVIITCSVITSAGLTETTNFPVILSPPGPGMALDLDGSNDYVDLGLITATDPLAFVGTRFTFSFWIKPKLSGNDYQRIIDKSVSGLDHYALYIHSDGFFRFKVNGNVEVTVNDSLEAGIWQHFAITSDGSAYTCYINGQQANITANPYVSPGNTAGYVSIGRSYQYERFYNGQLDEFQIWNKTLSQAEIRQYMCQRLSGTENGLLAYYRFDHTSGTTLSDLSGNGYHGTLTNMSDSDWITSGAAIGDISAFDYTGSMASDFLVNLSHANGDSFTATGDSGSYSGIHVYVINELPNVIPPSIGYRYDTHYWGVFPVGTNATYDILYNYENTATVITDDILQLIHRTNNSDATWTVGQTVQNTMNKTVAQSAISAFSGVSATEFYLRMNQLPQTGEIFDQQIDENIAMQSIPLTITDNETAGCSMDITFGSSNTSLISIENISYTCDSGIFYISLTPSTNQSGNASISITVTDAGSLSATTSFALTVNEINDQPLIGSIDDQACAVNTSIQSIPLTATDVETAVCSLGITFASSNATLIPLENISYTCDSNGFDITIVPANSQTGSSIISVTITDAGGLSATTSFNTSVSSASAPTISSISDQSTAAGTISFVCTDDEGGDMTVTATSSNQTVIPNSGIRLTGSENNTTSYIANASTAQNLTLTMNPNAGQHNKVTITVTVTDSTGLNDSTNFSVIVSPPGAGNAVSSTDDSDYANLGTISGSDPLALGGSSFTFSLWIKPALTGSTYQKLVDKSSGTRGQNGYSFMIETGSPNKLKFQIDSGLINQYRIKADDVLQANVWQHIACTGDGANYKLYVNGVSVTADTQPYQAPKSVSTDMKIGASPSESTNRGYNGLLDELSIWNRALSQAEIQQIMCQRLVSNENGLLLYYRFDHVSGTTLKDLSGNGYHATVTNLSWVTSGASIGDTSAYDYAGSTYQVSLSHSDGDSLLVSKNGGTFTGLQVYMVNESPNYNQSLTGYQTDTHYWGVHTVGTSTTYDVEYDYNNHSKIPYNSSLRLYYRNDNTDSTWGNSGASNNTTVKTLSKTGVSGTSKKEWLLLMNNYPQLGSVSDISINLDTAISSIPITVTDVEMDACDLDIGYHSSNTNLFSIENISYTCGAGKLYFSLTPTTSQTGLSIISISVTDYGSLVTTLSYTVNVNDPPEISLLSDQTTNEDTPLFSIPLTVTDAGTSGCNASLTFVSQNSSLISSENISYTCVSDIFYISLTPTTDQFGNTTITMIAIDEGGLTSSESFALTVNSVNDPPEISEISGQTIIKNSAIFSIPLTATDIETAGCSLNITFASSNTSLVSVEHISYTCDAGIFYLSLTPSTDQVGNGSISITITDAGNLSVSTSFAVTVLESNTPPSIGVINDQTINEDTALRALSLTVTDSETADCSLGVTFVSSNTGLIPLNNISYTCNTSTIYISLTPTANNSGNAMITLTVTDEGNYSASTSFALTVTSVNDPPTLENEIPDQTVNEDSAFSLTVNITTFNDVDAGDTLSYSATLSD
ncbi:MAG: hypothetical protein HQK75_10615, partial [Candidatus Magnetomorum sp.]|nr:hypothetical protein [Candidatus Magnetomorum sp.]